jgi:two-component system chemotaxis response regulator CheB
MPKPDLIVIGASAGGVEALTELTAALPREFSAAILVVLHIPNEAASQLALILGRQSALPVWTAGDAMPITSGVVYVAPPDHHMIVKPGRIQLSRGPRENGHRPAIDTLFRSAALAYGPRVISLVLTGTLDDGTVGSLLVRQHGGQTIAQDPEDALYSGMPESAVRFGEVQRTAPLAALPGLLVQLTTHEIPYAPFCGPEEKSDWSAASDDERHEAAQQEGEPQTVVSETTETPQEGRLSGLTCPDCGGTLWEIDEGKLARYRCRVGHAFTEASLSQEQDEAVEQALWAAVVTLEERAALLASMRRRAQQTGNTFRIARLEGQIKELQGRAESIKHILRYKSTVIGVE